MNQWLAARNMGTVSRLEAVTGGCICNNYLLVTDHREHYFLKTRGAAADGFFSAEAAGLEAIVAATTLRVPRVIATERDFLLLEYIAPGNPGRGFWEQLAEGLAHMHRAEVPGFGFTQDNFCGSSPQPNPLTADGHQFFADYRLRYQGQMALQSGLLTHTEFAQLQRLIERLPQRVPVTPPSLIHGDLWSGNIYCDSHGQPVLIDPACYWGWREADIAMTQLFGALPKTFYRAYQHCLPMADGWQQRADCYNLYHLLNHLNLFGSSYRGAVLGIISALS